MNDLVDHERYRTFWRRFAAGVLDAGVFLPLSWLDQWIWDNITTTAILVPWFIADSVSYFLYSVLLHGYFGQTVGKRLVGVKVFDLSGAKLSMKQAVLRDSVWIALTLYGFLIELPIVLEGRNPTSTSELSVSLLVSLYASAAWFVLELITMLSNPKRRAIHDFIAGSVVMRVGGAQRNSNEQHGNA